MLNALEVVWKELQREMKSDEAVEGELRVGQEASTDVDLRWRRRGLTAK